MDFFQYKNGTLCAGGIPVSEIADTVGTPVYIYSAEALLAPLRELQKGLEGTDHVVCFAVKSNSNLAVLKLLADAGAGMDLVSGGELFRAGLAGVEGSKVVFSGVGKTPGEITAALEFGQDEGEERGIFSFNVESIGELEMISAVASHAGRKAPIALRFNPDVNPKTHPYISTGLKKNKFGLQRAELLQIVKELDRYPGVELKGLSIHIGSQLLSLSPIEDSFKRVRALMADIEKHQPGAIRFIDVGGGVGITYRNEKTIPIARYCALIRKYFGPKAKGLARPLRILLEPGRSIAGNAGILVTEVLYRKERKEKDFLIVDAAMNDLVRPSLYGSYHEIVCVIKPRAGKTKKTDVVGPVCESGDCLASDRKLPTRIEQGELLAILSAGAYGFTMSGNYNSRPRPPEVLVRNGKFEIVRERETYYDLVRGEDTGA